jgi:TIR domain
VTRIDGQVLTCPSATRARGRVLQGNQLRKGLNKICGFFRTEHESMARLLTYGCFRFLISYRRDDSTAAAGRVNDRLEQEFGRESLFMDVDAIPLGLDFVEVLSAEVATCDVLLAIIGPNWLDAKDEVGNCRLDNEHDFTIRRSIARGDCGKRDAIPAGIDRRHSRLPRALAQRRGSRSYPSNSPDNPRTR